MELKNTDEIELWGDHYAKFRKALLKLRQIRCPKGGKHIWGIDGIHSNEFCKKCFNVMEKI